MDLMDTMLAELENLDLQAANININQLGQNRNISGTRGRGISRFQSRPMMRGSFAGNARSRGYYPPRYGLPGPRRQEDCSYCLEARRFDSSKGHTFNNCPFRLGAAIPYHSAPHVNPPSSRPPYGSGMKVLLIQDPNFMDLSIGPQNHGYNHQHQSYSAQEDHNTGYINNYPYDHNYAPAEISEDGLYEEQL